MNQRRKGKQKNPVSRRSFLGSLAAGTLVGSGSHFLKKAEGSGTARLIDRRALVTRHDPLLRGFDPLSPLSVGNGEFAFTADITGLQTFPESYERSMPLCTMSQWAWHTIPRPSGLEKKTLRLTEYETHGRKVGYQTRSEGQTELFKWLRENPHRLHLGMMGFRLRLSDGRTAQLSDISRIEQRLDLWAGVLRSHFSLEGTPVFVKTAVHPQFDLLAVEVESALISRGQLEVTFAFPYGSPEMSAADWNKSRHHHTTITTRSRNAARLHRRFEADEYHVAIKWSGNSSFAAKGLHEFLLRPARGQKSLSLVVAFTARPPAESIPGAATTFRASSNHWAKFWSTGGAIDFSDSRDARAQEFERRVVQSQYLTAIQCAGSTPPQETGLTVNSWYGKFHLEMHWWHATHFALWNRLPLLEKSLDWYERVLPKARDRARSQGYRGARWPKMVGPEGDDSPSPIGPLLIWQQPHPIFYAELCFQTHPNRATLERFRDIVFESAEFMASYAYLENEHQRYVLGPPVIPAQENHPASETWNPTFELAYWVYGLRTAQLWRERLAMSRHQEWDRVIAKLSQLPQRDGVYLAHENCPQTYTERNVDHPSMLAALGMLSGDGVDRETMRRTLRKVMKEWQWDKTWGWDYPMTAMTATRLLEPNLAVDALLMDTAKNRYLPNGHNWQRDNLPCYLPGNGGFLYATAMMANGWKGAPRRHAPGFPDEGSWKVKAENFNGSLLSKF
jgi:hypothetical protein